MTYYEPYIIVFWDKSKVQVSYQTGEKLKAGITSGQIKTFELGSSLYSVAGIEKIISKNKAYDVYPTEGELLQSLEEVEANELPELEAPKLPEEKKNLAGLKRLNEIKGNF